MNISRAKATDLIKGSQGKFINVKFVKKNGEIREMNCKLGVKKHLKGGISVNNRDRYLTVYDMKSSGYRNINLNTILEITCGKKMIIKFIGNTGNVYNLVDIE